ncbi:FtsJ-like methyltransferase family protein [Trichomonas vaginalis G3]|uniref:Cap-specific mRNA (nucleoside-2'-O-)-methyltransferase 1 n=1 Tax=Trichomonas vaginalis (strain ATCC PRA-98 / G3) TaxID=412133 RepID=A2G3Y9_TRIV3|nr:cap-specific mRNA (nucleoside-2'-O-)-methyltransferase 1 family [Trichomonas vaginalis G3]EAX88123.1 FtsJ-like methyltransferase family protein [Trichomonas vaginalis G3]KAI5551297.1 cap-specific mRNA (nucleoside-2'-O-)-methyltransferase 1 family [Trichomonas vaginalis G3]|eukprot:XP_001301053.1 FtsJ-like methyltransferase family protein [Trichomonas vaginalis G3]
MNDYLNLYVPSYDPYYNMEMNSKRVMMPSVSYWVYEKINSESPDYYSNKDPIYNEYRRKTGAIGFVKPPTSKYWKEYADSHNKPTLSHLEETHDDEDELDVFYSKNGIKMLPRVGATRQELIQYFGKAGEEAANELQMVDAPFIEGLRSVFDIVVDPDDEIVQSIKSNPKYPPVRPADNFPHHQTPKLISVPPYEGDLSEIDVDKMLIGEKNDDLGKSNVCNESLITEIFERKDEFAAFDAKQFNDARIKANPWETIGKVIFQNRAAMKMANLDAIFNFTNSPEFPNLAPNCGKLEDYFYFADICAGPGGFTDYLYWRLDGRAKGFGMTLAGDHDWAQPEMFLSTIPNFTKVYGPEGNGNIFNPDNIEDLYNTIKTETNNKMVQLVTADGGTAVDGEENAQEQLHKRLVLCQFLTALRVLRKGGSFLCKTFDVYTDFSVELLYLLAQCFNRFCIIKPYTSRPANSERYVVGLGLREEDPPARSLFSRLNESEVWKDTTKEPLSFFPFEKIPNEFIQYVKESNEYLVEYQDKACVNLLTYGYNPELKPLDQEDVKRRCLEEWKVPTTVNKKEVILKYQAWQPKEIKSTANVDAMFPLAQVQEKKYILEPPMQTRIDHNNKITYVSPMGEKIAEMRRGLYDESNYYEYITYKKARTAESLLNHDNEYDDDNNNRGQLNGTENKPKSVVVFAN